MALHLFVLSIVVGLLLAEARTSRQNEARLRAQGATLPAGDVYLALALAYPATFIAMGVEGLFRASPAEGVFAAGGLLFVASKALKYWAVAALGARWSFRVFVQPDRPLVTAGPYQYVTHPNYIAVLGELVGTAMMMDARLTGPIAVVGFGLLLWRRVRFETETLRRAYEKIDSSVKNPG